MVHKLPPHICVHSRIVHGEHFPVDARQDVELAALYFVLEYGPFPHAHFYGPFLPLLRAFDFFKQVRMLLLHAWRITVPFYRGDEIATVRPARRSLVQVSYWV
jgi:hypothetical protein